MSSDHTVTAAEMEKLSLLDLNGRQIKNVIKKSKLLALRRKAKLSYEHIKTVLDGTRHLHNATKETDRQRSESSMRCRATRLSRLCTRGVIRRREPSWGACLQPNWTGFVNRASSGHVGSSFCRDAKVEIQHVSTGDDFPTLCTYGAVVICHYTNVNLAI